MLTLYILFIHWFCPWNYFIKLITGIK